MARTTFVARPITRAFARSVIPTSTTTRFYGSKNQTSSPTHTTEKGHELDVQSHSAAQAIREKENDKKTERGQKQNPKEGHPKAPEPVIGMQDERGKKGQ